MCLVSPGLAGYRFRQRRRAPAAVPITPPNTQDPPQRRLAPCVKPTGAQICEMRANMETPIIFHSGMWIACCTLEAFRGR